MESNCVGVTTLDEGICSVPRSLRHLATMMSTENINGTRNALFYPVDLRYVTDVSADMSATADGLGQPWYKIPQSVIQDIILTALKVNYVLNYSKTLRVHNRFVPEMQNIYLLQDALMVPRFIRDIIREILRPMHHSGITYVPDIDLTVRQVPHLFDMFYNISSKLTMWYNVCSKLGYEMVPILPEAVMSVSLTFYSYETDEVLSFDNIASLEWRLEAFGRTKHLVHQPRSEVVEPGKTLRATSRGRAQEESTSEEEELKMYERPLRNRRILGMLIYRYTCAPYTTRMGFIQPDFRFPTEQVHSETPPTSRRASKTEQTMVFKTKRHKKIQRVDRTLHTKDINPGSISGG